MNAREKEMNALLQLLDDDDAEVVVSVKERLLSLGNSIIPDLENHWERSENPLLQERIETIIQRIQFRQLRQEFGQWAQESGDLFYGAFLVGKYHMPELEATEILRRIEQIRRNIWLEMNSYLTPLEQIKVMEAILYQYLQFTGAETAYNRPNDFLIHELVKGKQGNAFSLGILYLILADQLDLPVRALNIPRQFVLGWFSHEVLFEADFTMANPADKIKFFIDPVTGRAHEYRDVHQYLSRSGLPTAPGYFRPQNNHQVIQTLLEQYAKCFDNEASAYKKADLLELAAIAGKGQEV